MSWDYIHDSHEQRVGDKDRGPPANWDKIQIQLEGDNSKIILTRDEWEICQRFVNSHEVNDLRPSDYRHLPAIVRRVIEDWILMVI